MTEAMIPSPEAPQKAEPLPLSAPSALTEEQVIRLTEETAARLLRTGLTEADREALARALMPYINEELGRMVRERRYAG